AITRFRPCAEGLGREGAWLGRPRARRHPADAEGTGKRAGSSASPHEREGWAAPAAPAQQSTPREIPVVPFRGAIDGLRHASAQTLRPLVGPPNTAAARRAPALHREGSSAPWR